MIDNLKNILDVYKDKEHKDYLFAKKLVHKLMIFGTATIIWSFLTLKEFFSNNVGKDLGTLIGIAFIVFFVNEVIFSLRVLAVYTNLTNDSSKTDPKLSKWMSKRFWKYYNKNVWVEIYGIL